MTPIGISITANIWNEPSYFPVMTSDPSLDGRNADVRARDRWGNPPSCELLLCECIF